MSRACTREFRTEIVASTQLLNDRFDDQLSCNCIDARAQSPFRGTCATTCGDSVHQPCKERESDTADNSADQQRRRKWNPLGLGRRDDVVELEVREREQREQPKRSGRDGRCEQRLEAADDAPPNGSARAQVGARDGTIQLVSQLLLASRRGFSRKSRPRIGQPVRCSGGKRSRCRLGAGAMNWRGARQRRPRLLARLVAETEPPQGVWPKPS
jgi:hypothetical protein